MIYINSFSRKEYTIMDTAKIFTNGRSQAVRLPKEYRFNSKDVYVKKLDNIVILIPKDDPWSSLLSGVDDFSDDFMEERKQTVAQVREPL
jgi:antitoxin VapB